jgi:archaellum component FlaC
MAGDLEFMGQVAGSIVAAAATLGGGVIWFRQYVQKLGLTESHIGASKEVIDNMREELDRLQERITELEQRVEELTHRLAAVRMVAIDCYSLASECECESESKTRLMDHLKQIIRDS